MNFHFFLMIFEPVGQSPPSAELSVMDSYWLLSRRVMENTCDVFLGSLAFRSDEVMLKCRESLERFQPTFSRKPRVYIRLSIREARNVERDAAKHKGDDFTFPWIS